MGCTVFAVESSVLLTMCGSMAAIIVALLIAPGVCEAVEADAKAYLVFRA